MRQCAPWQRFGRNRETLWRRRYALWIGAATLALPASAVCTQDCPGGSGDRLTRIVASGLSSVLDQQVIQKNRGGASGVIAIEIVVKAPFDAYTTLAYGSIWDTAVAAR